MERSVGVLLQGVSVPSRASENRTGLKEIHAAKRSRSLRLLDLRPNHSCRFVRVTPRCRSNARAEARTDSTSSFACVLTIA